VTRQGKARQGKARDLVKESQLDARKVGFAVAVRSGDDGVRVGVVFSGRHAFSTRRARLRVEVASPALQPAAVLFHRSHRIFPELVHSCQAFLLLFLLSL
jgi:hypothetical protein